MFIDKDLEEAGFKIKTGSEQKLGSVADIYLEDPEGYHIRVDDGNVELPGALFHVYTPHHAKIFEGRVKSKEQYETLLDMLGFNEEDEEEDLGMKSLDSKSANYNPFNSSFITPKHIRYLLKEGFKWRDDNDSYAEHVPELTCYGCYKKYIDGNGFDLFVYFFETGVTIDRDLECGGNMSTMTYFYKSYDSFEEIYNKVVSEIQYLKS